jgi:hypothetical protein
MIHSRRSALGAATAASVLAVCLSGCMGQGLSADSSCSDYLNASPQDQQQAVDKLVSKLHADPALTTPLGFPEVAYQCSGDADQKLGDVIKSVE